MLSPDTLTPGRTTAENMPAELLARAAEAGAVERREAPDNTGAFFMPDESPAFSVLGDYMPSIESAEEEFGRLQDSKLVGELMRRARLSRLTGCIMTDYSRDNKGYSKTGIKAVKELGLGTTSRQAHRVVHFARQAEQTGKLPSKEQLNQQVDHICRNPACIYHTRLVSGDENNALMAEARRIEPDIISGQMLYVGDLLYELPWLQFALAEEGDRPAKVISTRLGPFALRLANPDEFVVYGERLACQAHDHLRKPSKKPARRKSRAKFKSPVPIPGHAALFRASKYRKRHRPTVEEAYRAAVS